MTETRTRDLLRLAIPVVWAAGMFAARVNPWLAIGIAAAVLVAAVLTIDASRIAALLRPAPRLLGIGLVAGGTMIIVTKLGFPFLIRWMPSLRGMSAEIYDRFVHGHGTTATLAFVVPLIVAEEIIWRGAFQGQSSNVLFAAAIYAAAHAPFGSPLLCIVAFVCGIYWSALRAASGSLIPSLLAHLLWDLALIIAPLLELPR